MINEMLLHKHFQTVIHAEADKILQSYFLHMRTLSRPFYINHEICCLLARYLFRLVINVQKKGTSLQYKIIMHNYIHNSSL